MKKILPFAFTLSLLSSCTTAEESYNSIQDNAIQTEISMINPTIVSQLDFTSTREIELEGITFTVLNFKHNSNDLRQEPQYLIQDQNLNWVEITGGKKQIVHRNLSSQARRAFEFNQHPDYDFEVIALKSDPQFMPFKDIESQEIECSHCTYAYLKDVGLCAITTTVMAISDGPLPFADYLAAVFFVGCENQAYRFLQDCVKHCLADKK